MKLTIGAVSVSIVALAAGLLAACIALGRSFEPAPDRQPMRKRRAARVLLSDLSGAILLVRFEIPRENGHFVFWALPGGEIEPKESEIDAARREAREELGLDLEMQGPIRIDTNQFEHQGEMVDNTDYFFRARCEREAPRLLGVTADERRIMKEVRWWTLDELEQTRDTLFPVDLAAWVAEEKRL